MMDRGIFKIGNKAALLWECSDSLQLTSTYKKNNPNREINQMFVFVCEVGRKEGRKDNFLHYQ